MSDTPFSKQDDPSRSPVSFIRRPKVSDWDEVKKVAELFLSSKYGDKIARYTVDGIFLQPHWEEGNWVIRGTILLKTRLLKKELVKFELQVDPMEGDVTRSEFSPQK